MGEINGLLPIIEAFKKKEPEVPILVTATSVTGLERAEGYADYLRLMPFDNYFWLRLGPGRLKIRLFVFGETELWPGLILFLSKRRLPMYLVNGRISTHTFRKYQALSFIFQPLFSRIDRILAADDVSALRFKKLGANPEKVLITGNAKYDRIASVSSTEEASALKNTFFSNDEPVLVLGSIWPGEEEVWFPPLARALKRNAGLNLVVAPRHKEKFDFFASALSEHEIPFKSRSEMLENARITPDKNASVVLLDTLGELEAVYSFADSAFIGATLIGVGGHNPLEAAAYSVCIILGPYVSNIEDVAGHLKTNSALLEVESERSVEKIIRALEADLPQIKKYGQSAFEVWQANVGATEKIISHLELQET